MPRFGLAANFSWTDAAGGNWSNTANWTSDTATALGYPSSGDAVDIPGMLTGPVILDITGSANSLSVDNPGTTVQVPFNESLTVYNGVVNNGTIVNSASMGTTSPQFYFNGTQILSGSGSLVLTSDNLSSTQASMHITGSFTQAMGHTISGAGRIGVPGGGWLINDGTINANVPGQLLNVSSLSSLINSGTMVATNAGDLLIGLTTNSGGMVLAAGGTVELYSAGSPVVGGTLASDGSPGSMITLHTSFAGLNGVTIAPNAVVNVPVQDTLTVSNGITNNGTIFVSAGTNASISQGKLSFSDTGIVAPSGSGSIVLGGFNNGVSAATLSIGGSLLQTPGNSISGAGVINGSLINLTV